MRKKYIGISNELSLIKGKVYDIIEVSNGWYRIVDESGDDYLFPPQFFVDEDKDGSVDSTPSDYIRDHIIE